MRIFDQAIVFNFLALIDCCGFTVGISQWAEAYKQFIFADERSAALHYTFAYLAELCRG
jgi:hypothetical protein